MVIFAMTPVSIICRRRPGTDGIQWDEEFLSSIRERFY